MLIKDWDALTEQDYDALLSAGYRTSSYVKQYHAETIQSEVHYFMHVRLPEDHITSMVQTILQDPACGTIFRIKGALPTAKGGWLKVNATKEKIELAPVAEGQSVLIVIGDAVCRERIDAHLLAENTDPEYVSI